MSRRIRTLVWLYTFPGCMSGLRVIIIIYRHEKVIKSSRYKSECAAPVAIKAGGHWDEL